MISQLCYFLHQSESKEIDEMKRIALVVMRKDRELKNLKKIIYIFLLTDNNQNEMGPTIWLRLFRNAHSKTYRWCMLSLFKFFLQDKNINRMMNINDNQLASLLLCTNQRALNMVDDIVHSNVWHQNHILCIPMFGLYEYHKPTSNYIEFTKNQKEIRFIFIIILRYHRL